MSYLVLRVKQLQFFGESKEVILYNNDTTEILSEFKHERRRGPRITNMLDQIRIPIHLKGYKYLCHAIMMVLDDLNVINSITKTIYISIAKDFKTTPTRVERSIRNAIDHAWINSKT